MEDLWSLTNFFGFATETFVLAVNILDRFLALMKVLGGERTCYSVSWEYVSFLRAFLSDKKGKAVI